MPNLFPEDEDEILEEEYEEEDEVIGYRNGAAFDDAAGDFIRDGKNRISDYTGIESWKNWCVNCIMTERYRHLAYSTDFGIELEEAMKAASHEESEALLTRQIEEALLADPYGRTEYVESIDYDWTAPDAVQVTAVVHGINDVTIDITAYITKEG